MRVYVDPDLFLFSSEDWQDMSFVDRLLDLIEFIKNLKLGETGLRMPGLPIRFQMSEMILEHLFNSNPHLNTPPRPHYYNQFKAAVLPEILRRAKQCPEDQCNPITPSEIRAVPTNDRSVAHLLFADHLNDCLGCSRDDAKCLVGGSRKSIENEQAVFEKSVPIDSACVDTLTYYRDVLPSGTEVNKLDLLNQMVRSYSSYQAIIDPRWQGRSISTIDVSNEFWSSYTRANVYGSEEYAERICAVISQIASGLNIDISAHGMSPQQFVFQGKTLNKWNAYVFQEGPGPHDSRCSRVYYGHHSGKVILYRYEPDAH